MLATQNPIEQEGTYPLPEAQLDRFMFEILVDYPSEEEEFDLVRETTADAPPPSKRPSRTTKSPNCKRSCAGCRSPIT